MTEVLPRDGEVDRRDSTLGSGEVVLGSSERVQVDVNTGVVWYGRRSTQVQNRGLL